MTAAPQPTGHPKGLAVLFTTEMWERFNFYGMRALLTLFMVNSLAFDEATASIIYGGFLGLCYLTPMLGGYISDRYLGNRNCILLGGSVMALGQLFMFSSAIVYANDVALARNIMWVGLGILIIGNGFFKPNISSMVGQLYPKGDNRLDSAFTIFYMGINLGAFLGITICPILGDRVVDGVRDVTAFKWGFLAAGIAMALGTIIFFFLKDRYVVTPEGKPVGAKPTFSNTTNAQGESERAEFTQRAVMIATGAFLVLIILFRFVIGVNWVYSFIYSGGLTLAGFILSDKSLTKIERDRIIVLYIVAFFVIFFWSAFEQAASSLTFVADYQTDRRLFGWDMPPSLVQNANSLFIIIFALPFSYLWLALQRKNLEPISPVKQSIGLALLALGYLIIALQVRDLGQSEKIGVIWLIIMYLFHTLGELCLSPIGLSLVSKLAPVRFTSLLMGVWFLSNASGYALAGTLGALLPPTGDKYQAAEKLGIDLQGVLNKTGVATEAQIQQLRDARIPTEFPQIIGIQITNLFEFFMVFTIMAGVAAVVLFMLNRLLAKMMHGIR